MLFIHLSIALASVITTGLSVITPTRLKLRLSYFLIMLTIASGTILVVQTHSPMLNSCIAGLAFIGASLTAIAFAQNRLEKETKIDTDK